MRIMAIYKCFTGGDNVLPQATLAVARVGTRYIDVEHWSALTSTYSYKWKISPCWA